MAQVAVIAMLLVSIGFTALLFTGIPRFLIWAQVGYWSVSYVLRPTILLTVKPAPSLGDSIADPRLAFDAYTASLSAVLSIVQLGLIVYLVVLLLTRLIFRFRGAPTSVPMGMPSNGLIGTLIVSWILGWGARLAVVAGGDSTILELLEYLAVAGGFGLLLLSPVKTGRSRALIATVAATEVLWGVISASKTPLMAAALALMLRVLLSDHGRKRLRVTFLLCATVVMFPLIQALKVDAQASSEISRANAAYPLLIQPLLTLVRRFDLLSAATDAMYIGQGNWLSASEFWSRAFTNFIPTPLLPGVKTFAGQAWADEVRSFSTGALGNGVSLADGFIAEGWALAGVWGIILESVVLVATLFFAAWAVRRSAPALVALGACLLSYPVLFERGILGIFTVAGKSLQAALIIWLIGLLVAEAARRMVSNRTPDRRLAPT